MEKIFAIIAVLSLLTGCVSTNDPNAPLSTVRVNAMGPNQWMISCIDSAQYCAEQANKHCPNGFDVVSHVTNAADYGRMTMIIKCL